MRILKDERLVTAPVGAALDYSWAAMSGNWKNTAIAAAALLVLSLLTMLPLIGFVASVVQGILFYALAYWIVDRIKESDDLSSFKTRLSRESAKAMLFDFMGPATGYYLGFVVVSLLMTLVTVLILWLTGGFAAIGVAMQQMQSVPNPSAEQIGAFYAQILGASAPALAFVLISSLFFGYVWPLVYGYALLQKSFGDSFQAVFMLFSPRFWRASFTGAYLRLVTLWMLIVFGVFFLMGIAFATLFLIPLAILILMWLIYFTAAVSVEAYNFSDDI